MDQIIEISLVEVAVPVVVGLVPGKVYLALLAVYAHGIPGVAVIHYASVGDFGCVEELLTDALLALAGALAACEATFGRAPVGRMVVVQLVDGPAMQPKGHVILGVRGPGSLLCYSAVDDLRDRGARVVVNLDNGRIPQLVKAVSAVREIAI